MCGSCLDLNMVAGTRMWYTQQDHDLSCDSPWNVNFDVEVVVSTAVRVGPSNTLAGKTHPDMR